MSYEHKVSEKVAFPTGVEVPCRLYKVDLKLSKNGSTAVVFKYVYTKGDHVAFLDDYRWEVLPKEGHSQEFINKMKKDLHRQLEHIGACVVDPLVLARDISTPHDFADYASQYASIINNKLSEGRIEVLLKVVPGREYVAVGKYPPFIKRKGDDLELSYTDYEQKQLEEFGPVEEPSGHIDPDIFGEEEEDFDDLPF